MSKMTVERSVESKCPSLIQSPVISKVQAGSDKDRKSQEPTVALGVFTSFTLVVS